MFSIRDNIDDQLGFLARLHDQFPFAVASAITATLKDVQREIPAALERDLDNPTPFTKGGTYVTPARKTHLVGEVGFKDVQSGYLHWQVRGGLRAPARKAQRLPAVVDKNEYGNLPAGLIRQLVARARAGRRTTKTQAKRFGVSSALDLFYGDPADSRPPGLYKRVAISSTEHRLIPIVVFPAISARYEQRFDFDALCQRVVARRFAPNLAAAWDRALATAK
jgi:hypothetical protein